MARPAVEPAVLIAILRNDLAEVVTGQPTPRQDTAIANDDSDDAVVREHITPHNLTD